MRWFKSKAKRFDEKKKGSAEVGPGSYDQAHKTVSAKSMKGQGQMSPFFASTALRETMLG